MARRNLIVSKTVPYHVTFRANNRECFPLPLEEVWDVLSDRLLAACWYFGSLLHAVVLMPNHVHLLVSTPQEDLGQVTEWLLSRFTRDLNLRGGRSGRVLGSRYYWNLIQDSRYYEVAYKYVLRNPVKAGLCERVEEYRFSSLRGLLGYERHRFPVHLPLVPLGGHAADPNVADILPWLNRGLRPETEAGVRAALRRKVWDGVLDRVTRKPLFLLER